MENDPLSKRADELRKQVENGIVNPEELKAVKDRANQFGEAPDELTLWIMALQIKTALVNLFETILTGKAKDN